MTTPSTTTELEVSLAGPPGPKGDPGDTGPQGIQGERGPQGFQGVKGDTGANGTPGQQGIQGERGLQGDPGPTGPRGLQGVQGIQGDTGATGPKGDTGTQGVQGQQGLQGVKGDTGAKGDTGTTGTAGTNGTDGLSILSGARAPASGDGRNGEYWLDRTDPTNPVLYGPKAGGAWPTPGQNLRGPQGPKGDQGIQGVKGDTGAQGPAGSGGGGGGKAYPIKGLSMRAVSVDPSLCQDAVAWPGNAQGLLTMVDVDSDGPLNYVHGQWGANVDPTTFTWWTVAVYALAANGTDLTRIGQGLNIHTKTPGYNRWRAPLDAATASVAAGTQLFIGAAVARTSMPTVTRAKTVMAPTGQAWFGFRGGSDWRDQANPSVRSRCLQVYSGVNINGWPATLVLSSTSQDFEVASGWVPLLGVE